MKKTAEKLLIFLASLIVLSAVALGLYSYLINNPSSPTVKADGIRVVCIGDSITYGVGVSDRDKNSYPAQLHELLGGKYEVLVYGLSGRTMLKSGDFPYRNSDFFKITQDADPDIVLIMLGTNDTKPQNWNAENYERDLMEFVNIYKDLPSHPIVYLMTPPAAFENNFGINNDIIEKQVVQIVLRVAEQTRTPSINIFSATKDHTEYFPDGVHPNAVGNKVIAGTVYAALAK